MRRALIVAALALLLAAPQAASRILVTAPASTNVPQTFLIAGSTFGGTDLVHVWAFPSSGPIFIGQGLTTLPDGATQLDTGSFRVQARDLPVGVYPIVIYVHNAQTGVFDTQVVTTYTIRACVPAIVCYPFFIGLAGAVEFVFISQCH